MYADRHARRTKLDPGSLGLSAVMVGTMMAGLIFSVPDFIPKPPPTVLVGTNIPITPPPEDPKPLPQTRADIKPVVSSYVPPQVVETHQQPEVTFTSQPDIPTTLTEGTGPPVALEPVKPQPVVVGPGLARNFNYQPDYPSDERRLGRGGRVVVRVLVGTDGRVKQVEKVSAASDSFFEATRRRAMEKWRLTPGTRDGVPIEAWRTMAVSFVMNDE
jgi:protein TonB